MAFPLLRQQRRSFLRRLLAPFLWSVLLCGGGCAAIEYFYGPGEAFSKAHPFLMGSLTSVSKTQLRPQETHSNRVRRSKH